MSRQATSPAVTVRRAPGHAWPRLAVFPALALLAGQCAYQAHTPNDPLTNLDLIDPTVLRLAPAPPGVPARFAGLDGIYDTADDWIGWPGDLDIVLRAGSRTIDAPIEPAGPPILASPALVGDGNEIDYAIVAVDGASNAPLESIVVSPSFGLDPVIVLGFADLDADGWIGPTADDGSLADTELEEAELEPVAIQLAEVTGTGAGGRIRLLAAGPAGTPLRIVLTAATYIGERDPAVLGGVVPIGPPISTAIPYPVPEDPRDLLDAGPAGPEAPSPTRPLGLELRAARPRFPRRIDWDAAFSLPTDGSRPSVDVVAAVSGPPTRFGLARSALNPDYVHLLHRPVRPGVDETGTPHPFEIVDSLGLADDGANSVDVVRIVALDRLGNITQPAYPTRVTVFARGGVRILSPDLDGDSRRETLSVLDGAGTLLVLDDLGGAADDALEAALLIDSEIGASIVDVRLADADVDDTGFVDGADVAQVASARGEERGEPGYEARLDVNGDGRVDRGDEELVRERLGSAVAIP